MSNRLISQLAHVELRTPRPDDSARFFREVVGLEESGRDGTSVYLRGSGDFIYHSLQLTEGAQPGLVHAAWRADGPEQLEAAVKRLEATGAGEGWTESARGHGPAYRYRGPGGHLHEILWEVELWKAPAEDRSTYPNRAQRFAPRGCGVRHLDHLTVATKDPYADALWYRDNLGYRFMEYTVLDEKPDLVVFTMLTTNEKSHDLGLLLDISSVPGRFHHLAFWVDERMDVLRAADFLADAGVPLEFGPGKHGMGEQTYLYFREPGGNRLEINSGGYRLYMPDWQPVRWVPSQGSQTSYRNLAMPDLMLEAFPAAEATPAPQPALANPWGEGGR